MVGIFGAGGGEEVTVGITRGRGAWRREAECYPAAGKPVALFSTRQGNHILTVR